MSQKYPQNRTNAVADETEKGKRIPHPYRKSGKLQAKRNRKRQEAEERQTVYNALHITDKINRATVRGRGHSAKELTRLMKLVGVTNITVEPTNSPEVKPKTAKTKRTKKSTKTKNENNQG